MPIQCKILQSRYADSVKLMNVARKVREQEGVEDAALVMGTETNMHLLERAGMLTSAGKKAGANDMILAVKGDQNRLDKVMQLAEGWLQGGEKEEQTEKTIRPRTIFSAVRKNPGANLAVISVPGAFAAAEAHTALARGLNVLLFSDNVSVSEEAALKKAAIEANLLLMGPGAGTAILNGAALGFANVVPRGPVGIVSAAGTGLQEVSVLLARANIGISQAIGVGGRDLSDAIGGAMTFHALRSLDQDEDTHVVVVISKLPSMTVAGRVLESLAEGSKPAVVIFMGPTLEPAISRYKNKSVYITATLQAAAMAAAALSEGRDPLDIVDVLVEEEKKLALQATELAARIGTDQCRKYGRGLFSGGTLCEEAMRIWATRIGPVWSNAPLRSDYRLPDSLTSQKHTVLDLGEEEFTVGRPHPMIDNDLRIQRLLQEARDPETAVIQMDVVLGYGAHPDPAAALVPAILEARSLVKDNGELLFILSITGSDQDPQNYDHQRTEFENAGVLVLDSNAAASILTAENLENSIKEDH